MTSPVLSRSLFVGAFALSSGALASAHAGPPAVAPLMPNEVAAKMQATYGASTAFEADFEQRYLMKAFGKKIVSKGHVTFEQPDRFLFAYSSPPGDVTVSDGKTIRMYVAATKTSCEGPVTASTIPAAFAFLSGKKSLAVDFNLTLPTAQCTYATGYCLVAKPKVPTTAYSFLTFMVDGSKLAVDRVTVVDAQGNTNRFEFTSPGPPASIKIKPTFFQWKAPAGTTIKPLGAC
jgi:outer membrane lipoprotein carrier protein